MQKNETIVWCVFWAMAGVTLVGIAWAIAIYHTTISRSAIEAGLVQDTIPGSAGVHWVKPKGEDR